MANVPVVVVESDTEEEDNHPPKPKKQCRPRAGKRPQLVDLTADSDSCCSSGMPREVPDVDSKPSFVGRYPFSNLSSNYQTKEFEILNGTNMTLGHLDSVTDSVKDQLALDLALARALQSDTDNTAQSLANDYNLAVELDKELNESDVCIVDVKMALELQKEEWQKEADAKKRETTTTKDAREGGKPGSMYSASAGTSCSTGSGPAASSTANGSSVPSKHKHWHRHSRHHVPTAVVQSSPAQSSGSSGACSSQPFPEIKNVPLLYEVTQPSSTPEVAHPSTTELPSWWVECSKCSSDSHKPYHLIDLPMDTSETQKIVSTFITSNFDVVSIRRIQNAALWRRYQAEKTCLLAERGSDYHLNEVLLYHTSRAALPAICGEGLDLRLSRAGNFGRGIYFR